MNFVFPLISLFDRVSQLLVSLLASKSSITIRRCYWLTDLISLLSFLQFLKNPYLSDEPHHLLHFKNLSQQCPYVTMDIVLLSAVPIGTVLQAIFYCQAMVFTCCISACWLLVILRHLMSMGQFIVCNTKPTQFNFVLPTAVVCTFSFSYVV